MSRKDKIRQLFTSAEASANGFTDNPMGRVKLALIALVIIVIIEAIFSYYLYDKHSQDKEALASLIDEERSNFQKQLEWQKIVQAYSDNLPITISRSRNTGDSLKISGYIKNTGNREIGTITLTVYCLDDRSLPVCEQTIIAESSDGKPLSQWQRRKFNVTIDNPPDNATGFQVYVSDIEFAE